MSEEKDISQRYRELPPEEPPRHLDEAILAAARRAAEARPAPLVVPSGRRRWYFPLAAAAIIVLAVAVTVHVQREQPDPEMSAGVLPEPPREEARAVEPPMAPAPAAPARKAAPQSKATPSAKGFVPDPQVEQSRDEVGAQRLKEQRQAEAAARAQADSAERARAESAAQSQAAAARPQAAPAPAPAAKSMRRADEGQRKASVLAGFAYQSPEQWLQGIADLRRQQRHEEADKALAEFRKRYPDYRIPEAMLDKVERR